MTEFAAALSLFIRTVVFFGVFILFADSLILRFDLKTILKSLGFLILSLSSAYSFFAQGYSGFVVWSYAIAFVLIFLGFVIDPFSKLKWILPPLILLSLIFVKAHLLLLILAGTIAAVIFQLVYVMQHRDMIPLGISFVLIAAGEYFFYLQGISGLRQLSDAGTFLYIFASLVLLIWLWSYLAIRVLMIFKMILKGETYP